MERSIPFQPQVKDYWQICMGTTKGKGRWVKGGIVKGRGGGGYRAPQLIW